MFISGEMIHNNLVSEQDEVKIEQNRRWLQIAFVNLSTEYTLRICFKLLHKFIEQFIWSLKNLYLDPNFWIIL